MKKHGQAFLEHIYENAKLENNEVENFNALYKTLSLLCVEMNSEETLTDLLRLVFALQVVRMK